ncbi:energy-coupling factor transporter transmembrane component T family protein [Rhodobacter sp. NTK016B]|uniref:energy-coupling factor transporter transmembrane component T family protein n=1 Tax=Rhodobacter sp. NTK016B TaxID=2759676 RepID=UPI0032E4B5DE
MILSDYLPGTGLLWRLPPGIKLLALAALGTLLLAVPLLDLAAITFVAVIALYLGSGLGWRVIWGILRPMLLILAIVAGAQWWLFDALSALMVALRLAALLLFASLVTLTTRASDMIAALERALFWLRPLRVNPAKVSLALSLALRFIPVLGSITAEVREAQRARGLERSVIATAVPVIVRLLKMADDIADAIEARGYDPGNETSRSTGETRP